MCGRFAVNRKDVEQWVKTNLLVDFHCENNLDLRPSQTISSLVYQNESWQQLDTQWGIQPSWSKTLLINAQSETIQQKSTFKGAFAHNRCLIPLSHWYEWQPHPSNKNLKQKYQFEPKSSNEQPLFMAGIFYKAKHSNTHLVVTLTTEPTEQCALYHPRMPLLVKQNQLKDWFINPNNVLHEQPNQTFNIAKV